MVEREGREGAYIVGEMEMGVCEGGQGTDRFKAVRNREPFIKSRTCALCARSRSRQLPLRECAFATHKSPGESRIGSELSEPFIKHLNLSMRVCLGFLR